MTDNGNNEVTVKPGFVLISEAMVNIGLATQNDGGGAVSYNDDESRKAAQSFRTFVNRKDDDETITVMVGNRRYVNMEAVKKWDGRYVQRIGRTRDGARSTALGNLLPAEKERYKDQATRHGFARYQLMTQDLCNHKLLIISRKELCEEFGNEGGAFYDRIIGELSKDGDGE